MTLFILTVACLASFTGLAGILFTWVWPDGPDAPKRPKNDSEAFSWPDRIFERKDKNEP
jgi:hypothetical protein